jgi:hypothetical protein
LVIVISAALLGVLVGIGAAFALWAQLHHTADPGILTAGVAALSAGLALVAIAIRGTASRVFLIAAACSLALAYFAGSGAFSHLAL